MCNFSANRKYTLANAPQAKVKILCVQASGEYPIVAEVSCPERCTTDVVLFSKLGCPQEKYAYLGKLTLQSKHYAWPIDTRIVVGMTSSESKYAYFAGVGLDGRPMAWCGNGTKWSSEGRRRSWNYARLYTGSDGC